MQLAQKSDIILEGFRPGMTDRLGIGGILGITGQRGGPSIIPASQIADIGGGGMMATSEVSAYSFGKSARHSRTKTSVFAKE
jgi:crotonobetainyl-CoA:carnitine CoA-transferase CaiB-like acyl-CoA transferase